MLSKTAVYRPCDPGKRSCFETMSALMAMKESLLHIRPLIHLVQKAVYKLCTELSSYRGNVLAYAF